MEVIAVKYVVEIAFPSPYSDFQVGREVWVYMDDVTYTFTHVELRSAGGGTLITNFTDGTNTPPNLFGGFSSGHAAQLTANPLYGYCDGTTLKRVSNQSSYPYAYWAQYPNNVACQLAVCDLEISNVVTVVNTTGPTAADGSIQVTATSSNGTIRYSFDADFDYATEGNTTGLFSGLLTGDYIIYAKDAIGCQDNVSVTIEVTKEYGVKYRGEYNVIHNFDTRIEISERGYTGSITEPIKFGASPITIEYEEVGRFYPIMASRATVVLLEETEGQYAELYQDDDRKYKISYYKYISSTWVLKWVGFVIPGFYRQGFVRNSNNYLQIIASDQLGNLKGEDFTDVHENLYRGIHSQLSIIAEILKKTGLELNIRSADNIYETTMAATAADDPLTQAFVDVRIFRKEKNEPEKSDVALNHLIKVKSGLQLLQSDGYWWLRRSEMAVGTQAYREFTPDGEYVNNGTWNPVVNRVAPDTGPGVEWRDDSQNYFYDQNYGYFELTHTLGFDDNFIDEGAFEEEDIEDLGDGTKGVKNWSVQVNQPGLKYGLEYVENGDSRGAFYFDFVNVSVDQVDNVLQSIPIGIKTDINGSSNLLKFSFEYNGVPFYKFPWLRIAWSLKIVNTNVDSAVMYYSQSNGSSFGGWGSTIEVKNDLYIERYNEFQKFEITIPMPPRVDLDGTVQIAFYLHNHKGKDYQSLAELKAVPSDDTDLPLGKRFIVSNTDGVGDTMYFYELEESQDAESSPDVLRPNDFNSVSNTRVWRNKGTYMLRGSLVDKFLIDNVKLSFVPFNNSTGRNYSPPEEVIYAREVNAFNKKNYEDDFLLGDLPEMANAEHLYRGWLRLSDGTPTDKWKRLGSTESKKLLNIALGDRDTQLNDPVERIEASVLMKDVFITPMNAINDVNDNRYLITKYVLEDVQNRVLLMLDRTVVGEDGEPPVTFSAFTKGFKQSAVR
jgi:hypothetical protein